MIEIDNIKLTSVFAASIVNFITEKHEENKKFVRGSYELMKFDHYCTCSVKLNVLVISQLYS